MRILHTSDVHLRAVDDERWQALERVLALGDEQKVGLLVISGDLFDRRLDVHKLKVPLRDLIGGQQFPVVIIPGNHDVAALAQGDYFGENVTVLASCEQWLDLGDVRLLALPFEKIIGERVLERILLVGRQVAPEACNILLYHGELLDLVYAGKSFGDEEESRYMPVRLPYFDDLGFDYVLAGHFHSNFEVLRYRDGYFVYPGSPVSVTRKETGVRRVNVFETGEPPRAIEIATSHYEDVTVRLNPFSAHDPIKEIKRAVASCRPEARVQLTVEGYVDLATLGRSEQAFGEEVDALPAESISQRWMDVGRVLENTLFKRFRARLDREEGCDEDQKSDIRRLAIESMMESMSIGEAPRAD